LLFSKLGGGSASITSAPTATATVASFRTWRGSQLRVAGEPTSPPKSAHFIIASLRRQVFQARKLA